MSVKANTLFSTNNRNQWILAILSFAFIVAALWLPYHLNFAGYGDEWNNLAYVDAGVPWISGTIRSFLNVPYIVAHLLTPDSFAGMNVVLAITTFGRGVAVYALLRRLLPENPAVALVAGALATVYPGDVGYYALVCSSITTALMFFLAALVALVDYWKHPRWYVIVLMWLALGFSIGIYEVSYPLILAAPLILIFLKSGFDRWVLRVTILWYAVPLIYVLINFVTQMTTPNLTSYQLSMVNPDNSLLAILKGFGEVYVREFWQVWDWTVLSMPQGFSDHRTWLVILTTVFLGIALWIHMKAVKHTVSLRRYTIILLGGAAVLGIGYSLFALTNSRTGFYRTLFYGLPGAAIAFTVLAWLLSRIQRLPHVLVSIPFFVIAILYFSRTDRLSAVLVFVIAIGFLVKPNWSFVLIGSSMVGIAGATMMGFHILQPFADLPASQQQLATSIATQAPVIKSQSLILWLSPSNTKDQYAIVRNRYDIFQSMMQFVYKRYDIEAQLCIPDGVVWGEFSTSCKLERDAVVIDDHRWAYDRVIAFVYEPDKGAILLDKIPSEWMVEPGAGSYNPAILIDLNAPLPYRLRTVWSGIH